MSKFVDPVPPGVLTPDEPESPPPTLPPTSVRHARLTVSQTPDGRNSLLFMYDHVSVVRVALNFIAIMIGRHAPSLAFKRWLFRRRGMTVGNDVSFAWTATPDLLYPELIQVGDNTIIGYNTTILAHEYLRAEWRIGPVQIGRDVTIGANCTILPGVVIGDGATVSAMSLVNKDVPPRAKVGGVPIRFL